MLAFRLSSLLSSWFKKEVHEQQTTLDYNSEAKVKKHWYDYYLSCTLCQLHYTTTWICGGPSAINEEVKIVFTSLLGISGCLYIYMGHIKILFCLSWGDCFVLSLWVLNCGPLFCIRLHLLRLCKTCNIYSPYMLLNKAKSTE